MMAVATKKFGPTAALSGSANFDPSVRRLLWSRVVQNVLVVKKPLDEEVDDAFIELLNWMSGIKNLKIFVEANVHSDCIDKLPRSSKLQVLMKGRKDERSRIELIVVIGGDGSLLYISNIFEYDMPPVVAFKMGTLSFLIPFDFADYPQLMPDILKGLETCVGVRNRLRSSLIKKQDMPGSSVISRTVLNEVVVSHDEAGALCIYELSVEEKLVAVVHADGLVVTTATGSTAYCASAGGPLVHPDSDNVVIVAICPHSLCFRPLVLPGHLKIKVCLATSSRHNAWATFDGRSKTKLEISDVLEISSSDHPLALLCRNNGATDWFQDLSACLHWNVRDVVNEDVHASASSTSA